MIYLLINCAIVQTIMILRNNCFTYCKYDFLIVFIHHLSTLINSIHLSNFQFSTTAKMATIPQQLGFNEEETKVFNELTGRERRALNALLDNNSKIMFIRGMVGKRKNLA